MGVKCGWCYSIVSRVVRELIKYFVCIDYFYRNSIAESAIATGWAVRAMDNQHKSFR